MRRRGVGTLFFAATAASLAFGAGCAAPKPAVTRYGSVIGIKKEAIPEYKRLHAAAWPGVLKALREGNIRNYSIYLAEVEKDRFYLFSYYEYTGKDFAADGAKIRADKTIQEWLKHTDPLQDPVPLRKADEWWMGMEEVFHTD